MPFKWDKIEIDENTNIVKQWTAEDWDKFEQNMMNSKNLGEIKNANEVKGL